MDPQGGKRRPKRRWRWYPSRGVNMCLAWERINGRYRRFQKTSKNAATTRGNLLRKVTYPVVMAILSGKDSQWCIMFQQRDLMLDRMKWYEMIWYIEAANHLKLCADRECGHQPFAKFSGSQLNYWSKKCESSRIAGARRQFKAAAAEIQEKILFQTEKLLRSEENIRYKMK